MSVLPIEWSCSECGSLVETKHHNFIFSGKFYAACSAVCRKIKIRKLIAEFNLERS